MIAKVRIAPIERWCKWANRPNHSSEEAERIVGLTVGIIAETCDKRETKGMCDGLSWEHEFSSVNEMRAHVGRKPLEPGTAKRYLCQHMLEMD